MPEIFEYQFFQNALMAAFLISLACGIIGPLIMINRLFSMAGGIIHAAFGGIGISFYFALPLFFSTGIFTLISALIVAYLSQNYPHRSDNIIAVIWAFGMALGIILIDLSPGYQSDLMAYLFGSILASSSLDLWLMLGIDLVFIILILCFYRQFIIVSFDKEFALLKGVRANFFYYLLIAMIAFCVVICIKGVGLILIIALLSIPCFIAELFSKKLGSMMILSTLFSLSFCLLGLWLSYMYDTSSGASIIMIASLGFVLALLFKALKAKFA